MLVDSLRMSPPRVRIEPVKVRGKLEKSERPVCQSVVKQPAKIKDRACQSRGRSPSILKLKSVVS